MTSPVTLQASTKRNHENTKSRKRHFSPITLPSQHCGNETLLESRCDRITMTSPVTLQPRPRKRNHETTKPRKRNLSPITLRSQPDRNCGGRTHRLLMRSQRAFRGHARSVTSEVTVTRSQRDTRERVFSCLRGFVVAFRGCDRSVTSEVTVTRSQRDTREKRVFVSSRFRGCISWDAIAA
jgi:hypothetical protein